MQLCRITFVGTGRQAYLLNIPGTGVYLLNERSMRFIKCKKISKPFHTSKISSIQHDQTAGLQFSRESVVRVTGPSIARLLSEHDEIAEVSVGGNRGQHITGTLADGTPFAFLQVTA